MASAGAQRGPRSHSADPRQQILCPDFPASSHGQPTQKQRDDTPHLSMYTCQECGKGFIYATDMLNHQEVEHTLPKPHQCPACGQEFSLGSSLQLHECDVDSFLCELCHGELQLGSPCPECRAHTSDRDRLQDKSLHRQPHVLDSSPYACALCGRGFSQKQALLQHQQAGCSKPPSPSNEADARSLLDDSAPPKGNSSRSDPSDAPGPSSRVVGLSHFCSRSFLTEDELQHHKQGNHAEEQRMSLKGQRTKVDYTGEETRKARDVGVNGEPNTKRKSKKKLLTCRSCDMVFKSTTKLYMHRQEKHSREKSAMSEPWPVISRRRKQGKYPCQICSKVFFHHMSLRSHLRQHTNTSLAKIKDKEKSVRFNTKDERLSETRPNEAKSSQADDKTAKAGPGRPSKVFKLKAEVSDQGRDDDEEEEEEEEGVEEEEEEEEREFPCPSCAEVFSLQSQLRDHVELHQSSVKRTQCSVCTNGMDMCKLPGSKRHRLYHCVPCQQSFSAIDSFLEHCQEHLRVRVEEDSLVEGYALQASKA